MRIRRRGVNAIRILVIRLRKRFYKGVEMVRNVRFDWVVVTDLTVTKYKLYEVLPDSSLQLLGAALLNSQRSLTVGLDDVVAHTVVVRAVNSAGESPASPSVVVPAFVPPIPAAPTSLSFTLV